MRATKRRTAMVTAAVVAVGAVAGVQVATGQSDHGYDGHETSTPIKHLVVIFQENVSFDHYFATYPKAANPLGQPAFTPAPNTPSVNGLNDSLQAPNNPNSVQPFRLDHSQFQTADQDHNYKDEQAAFNHGLMDQFVEKVGKGNGPSGQPGGQVMGYYDGNTVTAMWNYAQNFAMSDNSYSTGFGPSTPGALNLISGQTHGFSPDLNTNGATGTAVNAYSTVVGDPQPAGDKCDSRDSSTSTNPNNKNIGDRLNDKNISWGWFQGGFANCAQPHTSMGGVTSKDYIPHHEPFQYFKSTQNLQHLPPTSVYEVGHNGQANHQYDLTEFWAAMRAHNMPAVSFLKAPAYQDGHAGYSNPLDEQKFLVETINALQKSPEWSSTAVVIAYDDSDGWYDHQMGPIVNQSQDPVNDVLTGTDCGKRADTQHTLGGTAYSGRCGYGPRQPLLVISPWAKRNFVDHTTTDQSSILRFIEENWGTGLIGNFSMDTKAGRLTNLFDFNGGDGSSQDASKLFLNPDTGQRTGRKDQGGGQGGSSS